jgi:hypothetical protein
MTWKDWVDLVLRIMAGFGGLGFFIAAFSYANQVRIRRSEWLKSLYEKFFETPTYKEVRVWLDYGYLHEKLHEADKRKREENEEKFTDFLNFFEFIGILYTERNLTFNHVYEVFDYYLKKIKVDEDCQDWIKRYSFEKLKALLNRV